MLLGFLKVFFLFSSASELSQLLINNEIKILMEAALVISETGSDGKFGSRIIVHLMEFYWKWIV